MPDYSKCVMYQIRCNDPSITGKYIGSTCNFNKREVGHKYSCNTINGPRYNFKVYTYIRDNGGWENWKMEIISQFPCNSKADKLVEEGRIIRELKPILNMRIPGRTKKNWRKDNPDKVKAFLKKYWVDNREKIKIYQQKYQVDNKEKINAQRRAAYAKKKLEKQNLNK